LGLTAVHRPDNALAQVQRIRSHTAYRCNSRALLISPENRCNGSTTLDLKAVDSNGL
jgi:hypothetical protein